ncbi:hypothetical protein AgCh_003002 [Apium graveolens]
MVNDGGDGGCLRAGSRGEKEREFGGSGTPFAPPRSSAGEISRNIQVDQFLFVDDDFNGHISEQVDGYQGIHGGFGYGIRNESGLKILGFVRAHALVLVNSYFPKRENNLITFRSGGHSMKIDYLLLGNKDLRLCKDCQVIPEEACTSQHHLLIMDLSISSQLTKGTRVDIPKILLKNLKRLKVEEFNTKLQSCLMQEGDGEQLGNTVEVEASLGENISRYEVGAALRRMGKGKEVETRSAVNVHLEQWCDVLAVFEPF